MADLRGGAPGTRILVTSLFNSFVLLTFDKTVILEVSRTGTIKRPIIRGAI